MTHPADAPEPSSTALQYRMLELITSSWVSQALYVAAELELADRLLAGPLSSAELAAVTDSDCASLERLLRALTTIEVLREQEDGKFELTPLGALLASDGSGSLRAWTRWWGGHLWPVVGNLAYSVKTGQSARSRILGTRGFDHLQQGSEDAAIFNRALTELTRLAAESVLEAYDFSRFDRIVDVGGGYGELLASILRRYPKAWGVLFDLPHAMDGAKRHLDAAGVLERCELVAGDFFTSVPAAGDAYLLKSVLHDWNDDNCTLILESCRRGMDREGRLLVVEQVLPERLGATESHRALASSDLLMLVAHAARERTERELQELLGNAGFTIERVLAAGPTFSVIEARPTS